MPLELVEFADNPAPRCPCVFVLDVSASMTGPPIDALNDGLRTWQREMSRTAGADRLDIAIVTFGSSVQVVQPFVAATAFRAPVLVARGQTHLGRGIQTALTLVGERRSQYRDQGVTCQRPWVLLITDGAPTGEPDYVVEQARSHLLAAQSAHDLAFIAVGTTHADARELTSLTLPDQPPILLTHAQLGDLFLWLCDRSLSLIGASSRTSIAFPSSLQLKG
jgi:uncharacterized protein YegL